MWKTFFFSPHFVAAAFLCTRFFPCTHKHHKFTHNSMNHLLFSLFSRRQIKFDLVLSFDFLFWKRKNLFNFPFSQDCMEMTIYTMDFSKSWQREEKLTTSFLPCGIKPTLSNILWRRKFARNWPNLLIFLTNRCQIRRRCRCLSTPWTWCKKT